MGGTPKPRLLGPLMSAAMVVGLMIGSGVFLLPVTLAPFGANVFIAWGVTIAGTLCLAFAFATLAARLDGGPDAYLKSAFGEPAAFLILWSYLASNWSGCAAVAIAAVGALGFAFPLLGGQALVAPLAITFILLFAIVAVMGARSAGWMQVVTTGLKIIPLVAVVAIAVHHGVQGKAFQPMPSATLAPSAVASAAALMFFSFLGFEAAALAASKTANARRIVPIATIGGTLVTAIIYVGVCTAVILLVPLGQLTSSPQPFADAIAPAWGDTAASLVAIFVAISALGALNAMTLIDGEIGFALARDGGLPRVMARENRRGAPGVSIMVSSTITAVLVWSKSGLSLGGLFAFMTLLSTVSTLVLYAACAIAALKQSITRLAKGVAALGLLFALWTFYGAGLEACLWGAALLIAGIPIWLGSRALNRRRATGPAPAE